MNNMHLEKGEVITAVVQMSTFVNFLVDMSMHLFVKGDAFSYRAYEP